MGEANFYYFTCLNQFDNLILLNHSKKKNLFKNGVFWSDYQQCEATMGVVQNLRQGRVGAAFVGTGTSRRCQGWRRSWHERGQRPLPPEYYQNRGRQPSDRRRDRDVVLRRRSHRKRISHRLQRVIELECW